MIPQYEEIILANIKGNSVGLQIPRGSSSMTEITLHYCKNKGHSSLFHIGDYHRRYHLAAQFDTNLSSSVPH